MLRQAHVPHFWLLIFLLAVLLLMAGGRVAPQDEETAFRMTANLLAGRLTITNQTVTLAAQTYPGFLPARPHTFITTWSGPGIDGQIYPQYTHAQSLFEVPLYLLGRMLGGAPLTLSSVELTKFTTSLLNPILIALTGWLVAVFAGRLGLSYRLSVVLGLAATFATMTLPYIDTNFSEPLLTVAMLAATYAIYCARFDPRLRYVLSAGAGLGLVLYTRERSIIFLPPFFIYFLVTQPRRQWLRWLVFLIPIGIAGGLIGAWNWIRFGSPLITSYAAWQPGTGFGTPIIAGVYGLWLSAGKGLLIYNPIGWLGLIGLIPLWRRDRSLAMLIGLLLLIPTIFFARYDLWTGGWNWGPRYLLPMVPLLVITAGVWVHSQPVRFRQGTLIAVCLLGVLLNGPAILVDHSRYFVEAGERDPDHYLTRTTVLFEASPLTQQWPAVFEVARLLQQPAAWSAARQIVDQHLQSIEAGHDLESISTRLLWVDEFLRLNLPAPWFFRMLVLGFYPVGVIGLVVGVLLLTVIVAGYKLFRSLHSGAPTLVGEG
jgi:hypothetical protein